MIKLVSLHEHPAATDPVACLVSPARQRDAIYKTRDGFVGVWMGQAIEGYFLTYHQAQHALDMLTVTNGKEA